MSEIAEFWAMVELLGRQRVIGRCRWLMQGQSCVLLQIEVVGPDPEKFVYTEFYGSGAVFRISPCDEDQARKIAAFHRYTGMSEIQMVLDQIADRERQPQEPTPIEDENENEVPF